LPLVQTDPAKGGRLEAPGAQSAPDGPSRCAWCYGSPGIARALWLAGEALDRADYRDLAVSAMEAVFRRPISVRWIDSPTFCHGVAGLLAIALRFSHDLGGAAFSDEIASLVQQLLDSYEPESLLGFRHLEIRDNEMDQPGLLEGAPGVALALLASATGAEPTWDRLFLLS
jgi:lantibiotic biosynthesis protein